MAGWTEEDFISRLGVLSEERYTYELLRKVEMWHGNSCGGLIAELAERVRARLFDLSSFMKEVKQKWRSVGAAYRKILFGAGEAKVGGVKPDGREVSRRGFTQEEIEAVWKAGGKLTMAQVLRCRVTYFTEGIAIGGRGFLSSWGEATEEGRRGTAKSVGGAELGGLMFLGLRKENAIRAPG